MDFKTEINELENIKEESSYIIHIGNIPILFTAVHTMKQVKEDGSIKLNEPYTKAIALYLNKYFNTSCMVKTIDTGIDSNKDNSDIFKEDLIKNNNAIFSGEYVIYDRSGYSLQNCLFIPISIRD